MTFPINDLLKARTRSPYHIYIPIIYCVMRGIIEKWLVFYECYYYCNYIQFRFVWCDCGTNGCTSYTICRRIQTAYAAERSWRQYTWWIENHPFFSPMPGLESAETGFHLNEIILYKHTFIKIARKPDDRHMTNYIIKCMVYTEHCSCWERAVALAWGDHFFLLLPIASAKSMNTYYLWQNRYCIVDDADGKWVHV